jgi:putative nucleotidyltransferase with HDIG domain
MMSLPDIIAHTRALGPLPPTAVRLAGVVSRPDHTIEEVVEVIRYDQALTVEVLRAANSALSASTRKIATLREAVMRLGGARILEQLLARHLTKTIAAPLAGYGYAESELWRHSIAAAAAAEALSVLAKTPVTGLAFTAALLHDVGKLLLERSAPAEAMDRLWRIVGQQQLSCSQAEAEVFGYTHAEVGGALVAAWGLPQALVDAIGNHHAVKGCDDPLTNSVIVANLVARAIGAGIGHEGMSVRVDDRLGERMGLTRELFEKICATTALKVKEIQALYE